MSRQTLVPMTSALVALLLQACGGPVTPPPVVVDSKLSDIQAKVFNLSCATSGCHNTAGARLSGNLDLTDGKAFAQLVGVASDYPHVTLKRVAAGKPEESFLILKIADPAHLDQTTYGTPMPSGSDALPAQYVEAITKWVKDGALNN